MVTFVVRSEPKGCKREGLKAFGMVLLSAFLFSESVSKAGVRT